MVCASLLHDLGVSSTAVHRRLQRDALDLVLTELTTWYRDVLSVQLAVVDPTSLMYLKGATIDFVDSLMGGGFRIDNPNAVSSCGCGHSFRSADGSGEESSGGCGSCSH